MISIFIFSSVVILSGWFLGYLLSAEMKGRASPTPKVILYSLLAVATPTIMAFTLATSAQRHNLISQFLPSEVLKWLGLALVIPFAIILAGHVAGILVGKGRVGAIPPKDVVKQSLQMIPMLIVWGLLEEIGWRGYLVGTLSQEYSALSSSLFVGLIWGIWHAPQMITNPQLKEKMKGRIKTGILLWTLQCIALGGVLGWLQLSSGSFVFPSIAHALVNLFGSISEKTLGSERDPVISGDSGIGSLAASIVILLIVFLLN